MSAWTDPIHLSRLRQDSSEIVLHIKSSTDTIPRILTFAEFGPSRPRWVRTSRAGNLSLKSHYLKSKQGGQKVPMEKNMINDFWFRIKYNSMMMIYLVQKSSIFIFWCTSSVLLVWKESSRTRRKSNIAVCFSPPPPLPFKKKQKKKSPLILLSKHFVHENDNKLGFFI